MRNILENIVNWLINDNCFPWFAGSGFAFIFCSVLLVGIVACIFSKKVRNLFF